MVKKIINNNETFLVSQDYDIDTSSLLNNTFLPNNIQEQDNIPTSYNLTLNLSSNIQITGNLKSLVLTNKTFKVKFLLSSQNCFNITEELTKNTLLLSSYEVYKTPYTLNKEFELQSVKFKSFLTNIVKAEFIFFQKENN